MAISTIVVLVVVAGLAVFRALEARRAWRDRGWSPNPAGGLVLAPFGRGAMRGAGRTVAAQALILASAAIVVAFAGISTGPATQHWVSAIRGAGIAVGLAGVLAGGLAAVLIIRVNRPKFMVPPRLRSEEPGGR
jgi:hypothetical protein